MPGGIRKHKRRQKDNVAYKQRNEEREKTGERPRGAGYKDIKRENDMFVKYYQAQNICPQQDFPSMIDALKRDLPASFRITGFRSQAKALLKIIEGKYFKDLVDLKSREGEGVLPKCLEWFPDKLAYQLNITRNHIRREEVYFKLHNFLISETESGNISRQETVSMIPPLVLDVQSHHKVLDMCAAPGSKTAQLIESLHAVEDVLPTGLVVANDSDNSRCYMLVHQAKRLQSPCYIIINHDASCLPNLQVRETRDDDTSLVNLKFDRILADVPCTGDGTLRKNADIWPKWNVSNGNNLHGVQYRIVKRGLELLEVGGRLVYSTCSLNPVENEAVLHRMLKDTEGSVGLVDISDKLPGLVYQQGVNCWKVSGKNKYFGNSSEEMELYSSYEDVPDHFKSQITKTMFPPTADEAEKYHLERCIRILPHHQDTGGFFVALLEKTSLCPWESTKHLEVRGDEDVGNEEAATENKRPTKGPPRKKPRFTGFREDPFVYMDEDDPLFPKLKEYYDLSLPSSLFLTRCQDKSKKNNLYFTNSLVKDVVVNNHERIKIINTGVKAFARCENKGSTNEFRLAQEGALNTIPFIKKRKIFPSKDDLEILLVNSDIDKPPDISGFSDEFQNQIKQLETGSVAMIYEKKMEEEGKFKVEVVGWKGKSSLRAYVPRNERLHYLRLIGGDTSKFEVNKFVERKERQLDGVRSEDWNTAQGETVGNGKLLGKVENKSVKEEELMDPFSVMNKN